MPQHLPDEDNPWPGSPSDDSRRAWFDAGYQAGLNAALHGDETLPAEMIARRTMAIIEVQRSRDADMRRLSEAEARGQREYALERQRQGLITYDSHLQFLEPTP